MDLKKEAHRIIKILETEEFYTECPCGCGETINLKDANLFYLDDFNRQAERLYRKYKSQLKEEKRRQERKKELIKVTSKTGTKSVNIGLILEKLAPAMKGFRFYYNDCRALYSPIDYLIFEGLSQKGIVSNVRFIEIKTGNANLSNRQRQIRQAVMAKKIEWKNYEI